MKIVIDFQGAQASGRYRGIGRYSTSLVTSILKINKNFDIHLILNDQFQDTIALIMDEFKDILSIDNIHVWNSLDNLKECQDTKNEWRSKSAAYIREAYILSLNPDAIFICSMFEGFIDNAITSVNLIKSNVPTISIVYDFIPFYNREQYLPENTPYEEFYFNKIKYLKKTSYLCAISNSSLEEAVSVLEYNRNNIFNIQGGCDKIFKPINISDVNMDLLKKFNITKQFIMYTGGVDKRKNIERLVEAYSLLALNLRNDFQLVLVGKLANNEKLWLEEIRKKYKLEENQIIVTNYVSDEELVILYNLSTLFVFPSWHEGFGLPALEAMACGTAVIGSNASSIPEVIGNNEALFDPLSTIELKNMIEKVITNVSFRDTLIKKGLEQSKNFSWDLVALKVLAIFEKIDSKNNHNFGLKELKNIIIEKLRELNLNEIEFKEVITCLNNNLVEQNIEKNIYSEFLDNIPSEKQIWFGKFPTINAEAIDFTRGTNCRVSSKLHSNYDVVWLYEEQLFHYENWELILDESIRLLKENGVLIVRYKDNHNASVYALKGKLFRAFFNDIKLLKQKKLEDESIVSVFSIKRLLINEYKNKKWSIGILSDGKRVDNVRKFIETVLKQIDKKDVQFIIAGEYIDELKTYNIEYVNTDIKDNLARISEKKNKIINIAINKNLMILHDRYILNDEFFKGFDFWGYDYEFITVKQNYENGKYYPSYCGYDRRSSFWIPHKYSKTYDKVSDGAYLNGGLIIFKLGIAKKIMFNPLILHREGEDLDIAWHCRSNGITPRINSISSATTIGLDPSYTADYQEFDSRKTKINSNEFVVSDKKKIILLKRIWNRLPNKLKIVIKKLKVDRYAKILLNIG